MSLFPRHNAAGQSTHTGGRGGRLEGYHTPIQIDGGIYRQRDGVVTRNNSFVELTLTVYQSTRMKKRSEISFEDMRPQ